MSRLLLVLRVRSPLSVSVPTLSPHLSALTFCAPPNPLSSRTLLLHQPTFTAAPCLLLSCHCFISTLGTWPAFSCFCPSSSSTWIEETHPPTLICPSSCENPGPGIKTWHLLTASVIARFCNIIRKSMRSW